MTNTRDDVDRRLAAETLQASDKAFQQSGDVLDALHAVAFAAAWGLPIPPAIAKWLCDGIAQWLIVDATKSLDTALGLASKRGQYGALRPARRSFSRRAHLLGEMAALYALGASIGEAALLVHYKHGATTELETLQKWWSAECTKRGDVNRLEVRKHWRRADVSEVLSGFPDRLETRSALAAILSRHPR